MKKLKISTHSGIHINYSISFLRCSSIKSIPQDSFLAKALLGSIILQNGVILRNSPVS